MPNMIEFLRTYSVALALVVFFVVLSGSVFVGVLGKYARITGYSFAVSLLVTLVFVGTVFGLGALAWWCSSLCFAAGAWRNLAFFCGYSVLQATLGRALVSLLTRIIEKWYYL